MQGVCPLVIEQHRVHVRPALAGVQPLQLVEIAGKADGPALFAHAAQQLVVLPAGDDAGGHARHIALEGDAVVVVHVAQHRKVDADLALRPVGPEQRRQGFQLPDGGLAAAQLMQSGQDFLRRAGAEQQALYAGNVLPHRAVFPAQGLQLVQVLFPDALEGARSRAAGQPQGVQHVAHDAQVGEVQAALRRDEPQTLAGQAQHLADAVVVHGADALQPHLPDLPEAAGALGNAVDVLVVVDLLRFAGPGPGGADDGQRHVRLEGHEPPVGVGEGDDIGGDEKLLVVEIQLVLLKLAHFELGVAAAGVEGAEREGHLFLVLEDCGVKIHVAASWGENGPLGL